MKNYTLCEIKYGAPKGKPKNIKKPWLVEYYYRNPETGEMERQQKRGGINRIHTLKERIEAAKQLAQAIDEMNASGQNNPFATKQSFFASAQSQDVLNKMPISTAFDFAIEKNIKRWRHTTYTSRKNVLKHILEGFKDLGYDSLQIGQVKRIHVKQVLEHCWDKRGFGSKQYNNYLETIKSTLTTLVKNDVIETNPAEYIDPEPTEDGSVHVPLTALELFRVSEYLKRVDYDFYIFCKAINGTLVRPNELLGLKVKNIDFEESRMLITPLNSKTGKMQWVGIPHDLLEAMKDTCHGYNPEYYVWSKGMLPGDVRLHRNRASELWLKYVKNDLGINKTMYALKHSEIDDRLNALLDISKGISEIQKQARHSSAKMTLVYDKNKVADRLINNTIKQLKTNF